MYEAHFGLSEKPFSIAPDPQYLFMSRPHQEAMAHLVYGVQQGGGFILLTGEVGTGKTTLCRNLLQSLPENINLALILNAAVQKDELLQSICDELDIKYKKSDSQKTLLNRLNQYLLDSFANKRKTVLIIDEAQLLSRDILEQIRMLTNLETTKNKLLQIILIGQPELNDILKRQDLRQLSQRVTARYHLNSLRREDITEYVTTRLKVAGCAKPIFTKQALTKIYRLTRGIPRLINVLCDHSLIAAYSKDSHVVDVKAVMLGADDMMLENNNGFSFKSWFAESKFVPITGLLTSLLLIAGIWYWFLSLNTPSPSQATNAQQVVEGSPQSDKVPEKINSNNALVSDAAKNLSENDNPTIAEEIFSADEVTEVVKTNEVSKADEIVNSDSKSTSASVKDIDREAVVPQDSSLIQETQSTIDAHTSQFNQLLTAEQANTSRIQAFRNLSEIWETPLPSLLIDNLCTEVRKLNLDCFTGKSEDIQELTLYNRPIILVLENLTGIHRVILRGLNEADANVQIGDTQATVPRNELEQLWNGNYLFYWQPPEIGRRLFKKGNSGEQIVWLRQQINFALLKSQQTGLEDTVSSIYDEKLSQAVRKIQTSAGIPADGEVGLQTYMVINQMLNERKIPKLNLLDENQSLDLSPTITDSSVDSVDQELDKNTL